MSYPTKSSYAYRDPPSHNKFWTVEVVGRTVLVTFGRIGSAGTTQVKTFDTDLKARVHASGLSADKVKKGYVWEGQDHPGASDVQVQAAMVVAGMEVAPARTSAPAAATAAVPASNSRVIDL